MKKTSCVYCGSTAETKDHIPSKNLYKGLGGLTPIKVPSCLACNRGFSKDEEYFRDLLCVIQAGNSISSDALFRAAVTRSIKKNPGLAWAMFNKMSKVNYFSKSGLYLGKRTAYKMNEEDNARVFRVLDKYVKGLFFHQFGTILPEEWMIKHRWITPKFEKEISDHLNNLNWIIVKENTFIYGYNYIPKTYQSIWCFVFFGRPLIFTMVLDPLTVKGKSKT